MTQERLARIRRHLFGQHFAGKLQPRLPRDEATQFWMGLKENGEHTDPGVIRALEEWKAGK